MNMKGTLNNEYFIYCFLVRDFYAILFCMKDEEVGGKMLCHLVIDLNKELCTKSGAWTKFVQR